ncbi:hypothetical protein IEQ34_013718 [Dendrobium chrysotoxum]|uniref:Uncharacterized protein n=1 Tax=Dendrobium chrysotoxum TaxID=161865 RepID=A0AAV7GS39_DENCH|nr:hypothetical protein IEQ34_013718 [Dendrobium chrysotoxum]
MLWRFRSLGPRLRLWLRDHGSLQGLAILLLYVQIGCSMVGSLGALFNGILLVNMVAALFAIVAMEGSSQILVRTYGVLLSCMIFLDAAWFVFFSGTIWNFTYNENYDPFYVFSLRLAFSMQIMGFSVRILSSLLWIQMYRLGPSNGDSVSYHEAFYRRSFLNPPTEDMARQCSDNIFGSYVRIASPYTPLFDDAQDKGYASGLVFADDRAYVGFWSDIYAWMVRNRATFVMVFCYQPQKPHSMHRSTVNIFMLRILARWQLSVLQYLRFF